ncbi:DUF4623 domain-containing protein [Niabella beijingensis]|uniref:DUF4623 domain-containing protein n=1 Tax=Niabella beijingensis TaxID=2872700 RepID=UPI001CBC2596|nr:DUF4623 domain-containing protein [Niabella beijingensis]MBZ4188171.1 DUF4623 domain-containing protein [Niabella beijingensis]
MKKSISKYPVMILALLVLLLAASCQKKYPENVESSDEVVLKTIKIVNAGANGNTVLEGTIDENRKAITFPRLDTMSDFNNIKFEATMSDGAVLETTSYQLDFKDGSDYFIDGKSSLTKVIKVVNSARFREYFATLILKIPPFGADFGKPQIYDYTNNELGNPIYPTFTGGSTRGSGFDGEHILIVTRASGGSHLLKVSDIRNNVIAPIPLNQAGVSGGTFAVNVGAQVNGHSYIANLSGNSAGSPLKIYHWTTPSAAPQLIGSLVVPDGGVRLGDNMSANLDNDGNGYFFFGDNAATRVVRVKVTGYTQLSEPAAFVSATGSSYTMSLNRVGNTPDYIYTGYDAPIRLANESAVVSYALNDDAVPKKGSDAHVITFNRERYLIMTTAARSGSDPVVLYVYDITKGKTTREALELFNGRPDKAAVYQYSLLGPAGPNCFLQTRWYITKDGEGRDEKLTLYAAHTDAGFVMIDFPTKTSED